MADCSRDELVVVPLRDGNRHGCDPVHPEGAYEAVSIDGGSWRAKLRYVTWPHLIPTLGSTALTLGILYLTLITLLIVLTGGGPLGATTTLRWACSICVSLAA